MYKFLTNFHYSCHYQHWRNDQWLLYCMEVPACHMDAYMLCMFFTIRVLCTVTVSSVVGGVAMGTVARRVFVAMVISIAMDFFSDGGVEKRECDGGE